MRWERAAKCDSPRTVEGQIFRQLDKLEKIRKTEKAFMTNADTWTVETWDNSILCIGRYYDGDKIYGLFISVSMIRPHGSMSGMVCTEI